jgi:hypothetical protein
MTVYSNSKMKLGPQWERIGIQNWVWRNFLSADEIKEIMEECAEQEAAGTDFDSKHSFDIKGLNKYKKRIANSIFGQYDNDFRIRDMNRISIRPVGAGHIIHSDVENCVAKLLKLMVGPDVTENVQKHWTGGFGMILYFNDDYEGGEICYPLNGIEYKPAAGDIVIHEIEAVHGVKKVKSGKRYTHATGIDVLINFNKSEYDKVKWPWSEFGYVRDPEDFYMDIKKSPILHQPLADYQKIYVEENLYAEESSPKQTGSDPLNKSDTYSM